MPMCILSSPSRRIRLNLYTLFSAGCDCVVRGAVRDSLLSTTDIR